MVLPPELVALLLNSLVLVGLVTPAPAATAQRFCAESTEVAEAAQRVRLAEMAAETVALAVRPLTLAPGGADMALVAVVARVVAAHLVAEAGAVVAGDLVSLPRMAAAHLAEQGPLVSR